MRHQTLIPVQRTFDTVSDYALGIHLEDLLNCSTKWVVNENTLLDGDILLTAVPGICNNRDCEVCYDKRYQKVHIDITEKLRYISAVRFVTLTFGENVELTKKIKKRYHLYWYNYRRRLEKLGIKFAGIDIWEYKKQPNGLYHIHKHIAFASVSPHHMTTAREWADTLGVKIVDTDTKYRVSKRWVIDYFSMRISGAGLDKTPGEYITLVKKSKLYSVFGNLHAYYNLEIQTQHLNRSKDENYIILTKFLFTIDKMQCETIPPPEETLKKLWGEEQSFRIMGKENAWVRKISRIMSGHKNMFHSTGGRKLIKHRKLTDKQARIIYNEWNEIRVPVREVWE